MDKSNKSGAEALIHSLHLEGVELMFGYPGGAALHTVSYTHLPLPTILLV